MQPPAAAETEDGLSIMGKTKTWIIRDDVIQQSESTPQIPRNIPDTITEESVYSITEVGEEFHPDIDDISEEDIEIEELFTVTKGDISLKNTDLIVQEISQLQKVQASDDIASEEIKSIQATIAKLDGSEFLRMFRDNEEKAEKRNRELMKLIDNMEGNNRPASCPDKATDTTDDISLEDFL